MLPDVVKQFSENFGFYGGVILLRSEDGSCLKIAADYNVDTSTLKGLKSNPPSIRLSEGWQLSCIDQSAEDRSLHPCNIVPLDNSDTPIGILLPFHSDGAGRKVGHDILREFAYQLGFAVERARLLKLTQEQARRMENIHEASVAFNSSFSSEKIAEIALNMTMGLAGAGHGAITFFDNKGRTKIYQSCPAAIDKSKPNKESPAIRWVAEQNQVLAITNLHDAESCNRPDGMWLPDSGGYLGVPLASRRQRRGVIELAGHNVCDQSPEDLRLLETIGHQAAIAVENAMVLEEQRHISDILQKNILPIKPSIQGIDIGCVYASATETAAVGGDFYDFLEVDEDRIMVVCGDVCGKGVEAAATTAMVRYLLRSLIESKTSLTSVIYRLNRTLCKQLSGSEFVTMFLAIFSRTTGKMRYINCGHPPALLLNPNGSTQLLTSGDIPLGLFGTNIFNQQSTTLMPGGTLLLYTDGTTEARGDQDMFGEERLIEFFEKEAKIRNSESLARSVYLNCARFSKGKMNDDMAIVAVRRERRSQDRYLRI